jgi:NAD(P)-dependent dehydrogenase (short-subunit alcohol dehydrogenase family)
MFQTDLFDGQRILITGGGTGLGRGMGERLMSLGADVVICGRREGVLKEAAAEMEAAHGHKVDYFPVDIRNAAAVDEMVEAAFATGPVTGLINNAAGNFIARTKDLSPRGFDAIANIVMHGTFYVTHAVGRRWIDKGQPGAVVSILTTWVRNGGPFVVPSAMSKSAVNAMTMSLAAEWGPHGIRLNAIAPGEIPTEGMNKRLMPGDKPGERTARRNPMGRTGTVEEIGNLAAFLLSDGCGWINGELIALDGGQALATGGNFYELREWRDEQWRAARESIEATNARDRQTR